MNEKDKKAKVLVTGSQGQLGSEIREMAPAFPDQQFTFIDIGDLDLTDKGKTRTFLDKNSFDGIINCAAYTAVDKAESEPGPAMALNGEAPGILAQHAAQNGAWIVHISTDYVFDGRNCRPYQEHDPVNPCSVYGRTKLEGERTVMESNARGMIVRTSWLYSAYNANFVKTILKKGSEQGKLGVVFDQIGSPTYGRDLACTLLSLIPEIIKMPKMELFHYSNEGVASWYDFAIAIILESGIDCQVSPIETKDFPTVATRPFYSVLNKHKIKERFGIRIPHWELSLGDCIRKIRAMEGKTTE
jgi:dTDP-4-dehydrorhamnose reductase